MWLWQTGTWPERLSPRWTPSSFRYSSEQNRPSLQNPDLSVASSCGGRGRGAKVTHISGNRHPRQRPSESRASVARKAAASVCLLVTAFARVVLPSGDWLRILNKLFHNHFISFPTVKASLLSLWRFSAGKALCLPFRPCVRCADESTETKHMQTRFYIKTGPQQSLDT